LLKEFDLRRSYEHQVQQLFHNLISNALKYSNKEKCEIEIGCKERNEMFEFYVKDNGIGIEPQFFPKIFIIFQRLHTKTEYSGTGIGLAICKKIVERLGGNIWVTSEIGKGSTFHFTVPKPLLNEK
jgi:signal transduction histidine kinase